MDSRDTAYPNTKTRLFTNDCNIIKKHSLRIIMELATHMQSMRPGFGKVMHAVQVAGR